MDIIEKKTTFDAYRPFKLKRKKKKKKKVEVKKKKKFAYLPTLFQNKGELGNKTFFRPKDT